MLVFAGIYLTHNVTVYCNNMKLKDKEVPFFSIKIKEEFCCLAATSKMH